MYIRLTRCVSALRPTSSRVLLRATGNDDSHYAGASHRAPSMIASVYLVDLPRFTSKPARWHPR